MDIHASRKVLNKPSSDSLAESVEFVLLAIAPNILNCGLNDLNDRC